MQIFHPVLHWTFRRSLLEVLYELLGKGMILAREANVQQEVWPLPAATTMVSGVVETPTCDIQALANHSPKRLIEREAMTCTKLFEHVAEIHSSYFAVRAVKSYARKHMS